MVIVTDVRGDVLATGTTGEQGEFAFAELVPGTVTVAVNAAGYRPRALPVEVGGTGVTRIEVELDLRRAAPGRRAGAARSAGDARVTLVDAAGNVVGTATTGTDGAYAFTDLDGGDYTVIATGYPPVATALTVNGRRSRRPRHRTRPPRRVVATRPVARVPAERAPSGGAARHGPVCL